ncbi:hypothetical protein DIE06_14350 [Burkholderia sp. Bp8998]|nr:hypothetical protein DIE06_14350 [Burkholderia sp. Bp8998]
MYHLRQSDRVRCAAAAVFNLHGMSSSMSNFIESLIFEYVSYHMLVVDERDATPPPAEGGMVRPSASAADPADVLG